MRELIAINKHIWTGLLECLSSVWGVLVMVALFALEFLNVQLGGFNTFMHLLIRLQAVDVVLGTLAAICGRGKHKKTFSSKNGFRGIHAKMFIWFWIWLAYQLDLLWGLGVRDLLVKAYCTFELGSIAEIWVQMKWFGHESLENMLMSRIKYFQKWTTSKICMYGSIDPANCLNCSLIEMCEKGRKEHVD